MEKSLIRQRIKELSKKDYLDSDSNKLLFEQYAKDIENGIPPDSSEARTLLIIGNERLIYLCMTRKFGISNPEQEMDQYGAGMIGLIKAIDKFDLSKGIAFSTYATYVITNQIGMEYRKINRRFMTETNCVRLDDYMLSVDDEHNNLKFEHILGEEDTFIEDILYQETLQQIYNNMKYLTQTEKDCLTYSLGLFGNDRLSQVEIAERIGINQSGVSKSVKNAIHKLKIMMFSNEMLSSEDLIFKQKLINADGPLRQRKVTNLQQITVLNAENDDIKVKNG